MLGGLYYRSKPSVVLSLLGWIALASGTIFLISDYGETIAQITQLIQRTGSDALAGFASTLRPYKMATWISAFLAIVAALLLERFSTGDA